mgnify:CR=1 FL=1
MALSKSRDAREELTCRPTIMRDAEEPTRAPEPWALSNKLDDAVLGGYALGLLSCFAISHIEPLHATLLKRFPSTYPLLNVVLPFGRCVFALAIVERLVGPV